MKTRILYVRKKKMYWPKIRNTAYCLDGGRSAGSRYILVESGGNRRSTEEKLIPRGLRLSGTLSSGPVGDTVRVPLLRGEAKTSNLPTDSRHGGSVHGFTLGLRSTDKSKSPRRAPLCSTLGGD